MKIEIPKEIMEKIKENKENWGILSIEHFIVESVQDRITKLEGYLEMAEELIGMDYIG